MKKVLAFSFCLGVLFSQTRSGSAPTRTTAGTASADAEIAALKQALDALSKRLKAVEEKQSGDELYRRVLVQPAIAGVNERLGTEVELNLTAQNFAPVSDKSGMGRFLISVESVEPYLDGSKITIQIGNTLAANFTKLTYNLSWNSRKPADVTALEAYNKWSKGMQSKEFSEVTSIKKGQWSSITAILPGTKPDQLGYLNISNIGFGQVGF